MLSFIILLIYIPINAPINISINEINEFDKK